MSLVRFGQDDSDVYVYESNGGTLECCGCPRAEGRVSLKTSGEMIAHLKAHVEAGDTVPDYVFEELAAMP